MSGGVDWVDALLSRWGRWAIRCESGALGFAACSVLAGGVGGDAFDAALPRGLVDSDMDAVDVAVRKLPAVLREVVMQVYQFGAGRSDVKNAEAIGVSRQALVKYLEEAQRKIALDISLMPNNNPHHSAIGGNAPERNQPVTA